MDNVTENITFTACPQIQSICEDLFNYTGITYFNFVRIFSDGTRISLSNNREWMEFVHNNHKNYRLIFEEKLKEPQTTRLVWDLVEGIREDDLMAVAREQFDIDHGITLITTHQDYTEFYYFATNKANHQINLFYVNYNDVLQAFALYFKDKARKLIARAEKERLFFENHPLHWLEEKNSQANKSPLFSEFKNKEFFEICQIERYFLSGDLKDVYLSTREAECLTLLFDGMSPKEIAREIDISHRTVEKYIDQTKNKMRCCYRGELLKKAKTCGFMHIYEAIKAKHRKYYQHNKHVIAGI